MEMMIYKLRKKIRIFLLKQKMNYFLIYREKIQSWLSILQGWDPTFQPYLKSEGSPSSIRNLSYNKLSEIDPAGFEDLLNLQEMYLHNNELKAIPSLGAASPHVVSLFLSPGNSSYSSHGNSNFV
ncbi:uncharacterized protein LOC124100498 [Marmota monax]|uniref:uncharacterized protein LOC124100498 n=1 Tax=Marmota monax TaxID=9995 RepID=UPI001EB040A9|nr:uncharacterized protein LOC124100498 [Marmota monax]XP_058439026.1 uncharacterized protein LOC124100498 [Marmota monax]XP_058439027.1 uncharacterized protein LOC124100498 [Marmota monax]XP_058439028.1 uncharacterized protein LOC124100498 [Marmota monax]